MSLAAITRIDALEVKDAAGAFAPAVVRSGSAGATGSVLTRQADGTYADAAPAGGEEGSSTLAGLSDVDVDDAASGQYMKFNGLLWVPADLPVSVPWQDTAPGSPPTVNDEFDLGSSLNAKWSISTSGTETPGTAHNSTWPSAYRVKFLGTGGGSSAHQIGQAAAIGTTLFSLTTKLFLAPYGQYHSIFLYANAASSNWVASGIEFNSGGTRLYRQVGTSGSASNTTTDLPFGVASTWYLHLQRNSGNNWLVAWSYDAHSWFRFATVSKSLTVAGLSLAFGCYGGGAIEMGVDWLRRDWLML